MSLQLWKNGLAAYIKLTTFVFCCYLAYSSFYLKGEISNLFYIHASDHKSV